MSVQILDLEEWDECLCKMLKYHSNISMEIRDLILKIRDNREENRFLTTDSMRMRDKIDILKRIRDSRSVSW